MQPLKAQTGPAAMPLGCQSPSARAAPPAAMMYSQGIPRRPSAQGPAVQPLSYALPSSKPTLDLARSRLMTAGVLDLKHQYTITTGMSNSSNSALPVRSASQAPLVQMDSTGKGTLPLARAQAETWNAAGYDTASKAFAPQLCQTALPVHFSAGNADVPLGMSQMPSFMDSVAAFTEGFALTHGAMTDGLGEWGFGTELSHDKSTCTVEAHEIAHYESGLTASDLSGETSEQVWNIPEDMLVDAPSHCHAKAYI